MFHIDFQKTAPRNVHALNPSGGNHHPLDARSLLCSPISLHLLSLLKVRENDSDTIGRHYYPEAQLSPISPEKRVFHPLSEQGKPGVDTSARETFNVDLEKEGNLLFCTIVMEQINETLHIHLKQ